MSNVPMSSTADMECNSFFDHIDDLLDFNEDNNKTLGDGIAFSGLLNHDSVVGTGCSADLAAELSIPYEDIVQMEWLSMFMEDSFGAGNTMTLDIRDFPAADDGVRVAAEAVSVTVTPVQFRSSSPISVLESSSSSSTSSSSDGGKIPPLSPEKASLKGGCGRARSKRPRPLTFNPGSAMQLLSQPQSFMDDVGVCEVELNASSSLKNGSVASGHKKLKNLKAKTGSDESSGEPGVRKCLHCEITKTPQWRTGPLGPKTLCNACGVRYKSGRLFPEYRPAASPTFVPSLHSNSHKKVLEMRTTTTHDTPLTTTSQDLMNDAGPEIVPNKDALLEYKAKISIV